MLNDLVIVTKKHENAAKAILDRIHQTIKPKFIVTISGEVATGKSTVSIVLARLLKIEGIRAKILDLDDYYLIPPLERAEWRKINGIGAIGISEIHWELLRKNIIDFIYDKQSVVPCVDLITDYVDHLTTDFSGVDVLIINGLYSMVIDEANLKVFIENTYEETLAAQKFSGKEAMDDFRIKILEKEHEEIKSLKSKANYFLDFDTSAETYHL